MDQSNKAFNLILFLMIVGDRDNTSIESNTSWRRYVNPIVTLFTL